MGHPSILVVSRNSHNSFHLPDLSGKIEGLLKATGQRTWKQNQDSYHFELEVELLTIYWPIVQNGKFSAAAALLVKTLKKVDFLKIHVDKQQTHDQVKKK